MQWIGIDKVESILHETECEVYYMDFSQNNINDYNEAHEKY